MSSLELASLASMVSSIPCGPEQHWMQLESCLELWNTMFGMFGTNSSLNPQNNIKTAYPNGQNNSSNTTTTASLLILSTLFRSVKQVRHGQWPTLHSRPCSVVPTDHRLQQQRLVVQHHCMFECLVFLKLNWRFWTIKEVAAAIKMASGGKTTERERDHDFKNHAGNQN